MNKRFVILLAAIICIECSKDIKEFKNISQETFGYSICSGYEDTIFKVHKVWIDPPAPTIGEDILVYLTVSVEQNLFIPYWFAKTSYQGIKLLETKVPVESEYYPKDQDGKVIMYEEFRDLGLEQMFLPGKYGAEIFIMNETGKPVACFNAWLYLRRNV